MTETVRENLVCKSQSGQHRPVSAATELSDGFPFRDQIGWANTKVQEKKKGKKKKK